MSSFSRNIHVLNRCASIYRAEHLTNNDLGRKHHRYLFSVCRYPGISQEQLARQIYINKSSVTRQLADLESRGYVERRQSEEDKRVMLVYPTEKAYEILPTLTSLTEEWEETVTAALSPEEKELFLNMLKRVTKKAASLVDGQTLEGE